VKEPGNELYSLQGMRGQATPPPGQEPAPWRKTRVVGRSVPRVDAYERVSGAAQFPSDVCFPDMLYAAILGCPYPNAQVKSVDTSEAEKVAGCRAIITGSTPQSDLVWWYARRKSKIFDPHCRYEGDAVAAVAADTPYSAWDAIRAVKVRYDVLPFVSDERKALDRKAPVTHPGGNRVGKHETYERGNIERGFAEADVVLEAEYRTECELHTPMELHGCVARWDGDQLLIWESTQGVYAVQNTVAMTLGLPLAKVRVIGHYMGGGFGSKLDAGKYTIIAAVLARITARPVKLFLTREQTYMTVGNRPPSNMTLRAGAKKDGALTALEFTCLGTGGAYPVGGISLVDWLVRELYLCPNVRCECTDVLINAGPARPFRAPGHPQGSWALEQMMDALAEALKMDPVQLRLKNVPTYSQGMPGRLPYTTTGLKACIEEGAKAFKWKEKRAHLARARQTGHVRRGIGMAAGLWRMGGGMPPSTIVLKLFADGSANLNMGASDIGTGTKSIMAMIVSEELGLQLDNIQIENADTGTTQYATPSAGSKTVPSDGPAVRAAATNVKQRLLKLASRDLKTRPEDLAIESGFVFSNKNKSKKLKLTEITGLKEQRVIVGIGYRGENPKGKIIQSFAAQYCEVEVNTLTGEIKLLSFAAAHDSGRIMNRLTYESQMIGGITMGVGLAMTEARVLDRRTGKLCNKNWHDYKLPTALDIPVEFITAPLELPDNQANSIGAKGLGEPVTIPTASAIANAVYNAIGVRVTATPINPISLSRLLAERKTEE
jgi:CO/xanthine dehydrogenase Mo-binding subunit